MGELNGELAAMASGDCGPRGGAGVYRCAGRGRQFQGHGLGRQMLRGMIEHLKTLGCQYVNLDCLTDNDAAMPCIEARDSRRLRGIFGGFGGCERVT